MENKSSLSKLLPVLFGFFVMGFVDMVGVTSSYAQEDFQLSHGMTGFLPSMVFLWFFILSVPTGLLMSRLGRKQTVLISMYVTIAGMCIPFFAYNLYTCLAAYALLGIGNTIMQVSLNPLLTNVVKGDKVTSSLTAGQLIKAVSSFCGPYIAAFAAETWGHWEYIFPIYAAVTVLSSLWLLFTPIKEDQFTGKAASFGATLGMLKDSKILLLFFGILFVVGVDVGTNFFSSKLMVERCGWKLDAAKTATMFYFAFRTGGALLGTFLLAKVSGKFYFKINILLGLVAMLALLFVNNSWAILILIGLIGFACACVFPIIFAMALKARPDKENEISGLMITGIGGGGVITLLMGFSSQLAGSQIGGMIVVLLCILYLVYCAFGLEKSKN